MKFQTKLIATTVLGILIFLFLEKLNTSFQKEIFHPKPTEKTQIFENQEEGGDGVNEREEWEKMIHRAAPGTDWKALDRATRFKQLKEKEIRRSAGNNKAIESFANGQVMGEWKEKGSNNQAGNLSIVDYDPDTDKIYGISGGGTLFQGNLDGTGWNSLNDDLVFESAVLKVIPNGVGGKRILTAIGKYIWYSDDEGANWTQSTGFNFLDDWGFPVKMIGLDDTGNSLYYLVFTWDPTPWNSRMWLYHSTDRGQSFSHIKTFDHSVNYWDARNYTSIWSPLNSTNAYVLHLSTDLYTLSGNSATILNTNTNLPTNASLDLDGYQSGGVLTLYALMNGNMIYKSVNDGATWTMQGTTPVDAWSTGITVSPSDPTQLFMGAVNCYRSADSGVNWTEVNTWQVYYGNNNYLHADIMDIKGFEKADQTKFVLTGNHGGLHVSYDNLQTTTNIGTAGLNIAQYYDVRTDPLNSNYLYAGSQDQGHQRSSTAGNAGVVDFDQVISGDYGHMAFSQNNQRLWTVYPGGWTQYYNHPQILGYNSTYDVAGNHQAVSEWITPTAESADVAANEIFIAGGNINGGDGSYLIKLTALSNFPFSVTASQYAYDFRANSNSGTATISAIEMSTVDANRMYVATSDGSFFYSNDNGTTWVKSTGFTGPAQYWLYGSTILASSVTSNLLWFGGSGYSNPPVYKSTDGGQTFTAMNTGLPSSLVHELIINPAETLIFAATDVGPYVYIIAEDQWYNLMGTETPNQRYYSVEYVTGDIVRFGTYGRGIWDFDISSMALPIELTMFEVQVIDNQIVKLVWETAQEINNDVFEIEKSADGEHFEIMETIPSKGNANETQTYETIDRLPLPGNNYYRLKQIDLDGTFKYSNIEIAYLELEESYFSVFPNPVTVNHNLNIESNHFRKMNFVLTDLNGKVVGNYQFIRNISIEKNNLPAGTYFYRLISENLKLNKSGKILIVE